ncbi:glycosyltransferase family A protein [Roseibium aggregatum]|uniref:glycosyltransferase family A protein n=1 Tax=Roseibium aggregatum TaxID=187304 RepID=UPI003A7F2E1C|nr:glycosyltransferase [Roseibium aggregatum]
MTTLDILIPHYNDPEGLALSLRSISRQVWKGEYRIVVADDGSRPDHLRSVKRIVERSNLKIDAVYNDINRGRPYTRNVLLDSIDSQYVAWLDSGDEWYPTKLASQFSTIRLINSACTSRPFWVTCNYDWMWVGGKKKRLTQHTHNDQLKDLLIGSRLRAYLWTLVGSSSSFKDVGWFDERLPRMQDLDFFIRFILHGGSLKSPQSSDTMCVYHKSDVGRNAKEIRACNSYIFDKHRVLYNRYGQTFKHMRLYQMDMLAARFAQNNNDRKQKNYYLWCAFKRRPKLMVKHVLKMGLKA